MIPRSSLIAVVLPAPLGPIKPYMQPLGILSDNESSAIKSPNALLALSKTTHEVLAILCMRLQLLTLFLEVDLVGPTLCVVVQRQVG